MLPAVPDTIKSRYQDHVIDAARTAAESMRDDNVRTGRDFADATALYQPLITNYLTVGSADGNAAPPSTTKTDNAWGALAAGVVKSGAVTVVQWSSFSDDAANNLEAELCECPVQRVSTGRTTAWHGNAHRKLPKKVAGPGGEPLDQVAKDQQHLYTDYVEFTIAGGHKNKHNGIERGILDRITGQIYITAHYDRGSIVWLTGAPNSVVTDWRGKADDYEAEF